MKKHRKLKTFTATFVTVLIAAAAIILPQHLLSLKTQKKLSTVNTAPESYYLSANSAMAKNASKMLDSFERMDFISGNWGYNYTEVNPSVDNLTADQAAALAKSSMEIFFTTKVYPRSLNQGFDSWFTWETKLYKFTETTFNTYTTYLWQITFTKYDNSISHTVLMTEDGTILEAQTNYNNTHIQPISTCYTTANAYMLFHENHVTISKATELTGINEEALYPFLERAPIQHIYRITITTIDHADKNYLLYQYGNLTSYGFGIIPE